MGRVKELMKDYEENNIFIGEMISWLSSESLGEYCDPQIVMDLYEIRYLLNLLDNHSMEAENFISSKTIFESIKFLYYDLKGKVVDLEVHVKGNIGMRELLREFGRRIRELKNVLLDFTQNISVVYNSEGFYKDKITTLEVQKDTLEKKLDFILKQQDKLKGKSDDEIARQKEEIRKIKFDLENANKLILNYQKELDEKTKQENAIAEWNAKIKGTFEKLTKKLSPIKEEQKRLNILFWVYAGLTIATILFIVILEYWVWHKMYSIDSYPSARDYIFCIMPIPLTGALLWVFLSQMNRAQRQLVVLARHIHEIEYVEGLLLSINSLSTNMADSVKRVNAAIDRLLDNHLDLGSNCGKYNEESLIKESKKDMVPYDLVLKLLGEVKGLAGK